MALTYLTAVSQEGTTSLVDIMPTVAPDTVEFVTLCATIKSGTADAYAGVYLKDDVGSNSGYIRCQEPIRYRISGGSPDLLIQYRVEAGYRLQVIASANGVVQFTLYNRAQDGV